MHLSCDEINQRFAIRERLQFVSPHHGLIQGLVTSPSCDGSFYLHGAHVSDFRPLRAASGHGKPPDAPTVLSVSDEASTRPVLFMSSRAVYQPGKAIRGGVPICFPWFGSHQTDAQASAHGFARTQVWQMEQSAICDDAVEVTLGLLTPPWKLTYNVSFADKLNLSLTIANVSEEVAQCEIALHSYFAIAHVRETQIRGLESLPFLDQLTGQRHSATGTCLRFDQETDRIYSGTAAQIAIDDHGYSRRILVAPRNSQSTVVWNPWVDKAARLADFGDDEYLRMCCVETANIAPETMRIAPYEHMSVGVTISLQSLAR